jgi:hypothetical protein
MHSGATVLIVEDEALVVIDWSVFVQAIGA